MTTIMNPGQRQAKTTQGTPVQGESIIRVLFSLILLALASLPGVTQASTVTYYHPDALGSPVAATDETGTVIWREAYQPYGTRLRRENKDGNTLWFSGKPTDELYGLSYFGARWYSPAIGRFMAMDPVGVKAGNVHSFNRYAYANNNPYRYVDPDGRADIASTGLVVIGFSAILIKALPQEMQDRLGQSVLDGMEALFSPVYNAESGDDKGDAEGAKKPNVPDRELPKDQHGHKVPESDYPHTQLGTKKSKRRGEKYPQTREWGAKGDRGYDDRTPKKDTDWTDHGRPINHTNPHDHPYNPETGKRL